MASWRQLQPFVALLVLALSVGSASAVRAQQDCEDTPEGRICRVQQPITAGVTVGPDLQRQLGLVHISTGCSGTLLNRFWVLTARHCVTNPPPNATLCQATDAPLLTPESVRITADWAPGRAALATRFYDFAINRVPGVTCLRDIILVYLGTHDLGEVNTQPIYVTTVHGPGNSIRLSGRLTMSDTVTQYGRGYSTLATGVFGGMPPAVPSDGLGIYRSARFTPANITATHYDLLMNTTAQQVGHGGDSGGPTWVTVNNVGVGIAGVQSACDARWPQDYIPNAPSQNWIWASRIRGCTYVSTAPFLAEISQTIQEFPECQLPSWCGMTLPVIISYVLE